MASTSTSLVGGATPSEDEPMPPVDDDGSDNDTMERIPDLTMYKTLTLLPPSSVTRSKVVCKSWFSLIFCRSFARDHAAARAASPASNPSILRFDGAVRFPATIVDENGTERLALRSGLAEPREGYNVQNCCGSIACLRNDQGGAELVNPATGDCLNLGGDCSSCDPDTRTGSKQLPWYCLGRCASTGEYKVVRLDVRLPYSSPPHVTCEVCALGGRSGFGLLWREVGVWDVHYCPSGRGVHVHGIVYYLAGIYGHSVVGFDLSTNARSHIDLPVVDDAVASLSELEGQLCASLVPSVGEGEKNMDLWLWVLGDGGQHGWIHRYRFELDGATRHVPRPLFVSGRRMLIMKCADGSLCSYDVEANGSIIDGRVLVFSHKSRPGILSGTTADVFVESLLPLRAILRRLGAEFETVAFKDGEKIDEFAMRIGNIAASLRSYGDVIDEEKVVRKFLAVVPSRFVQIAFSIETLMDPATLTVEEVTDHLRACGCLATAASMGGSTRRGLSWTARRGTCQCRCS